MSRCGARRAGRRSRWPRRSATRRSGACRPAGDGTRTCARSSPAKSGHGPSCWAPVEQRRSGVLEAEAGDDLLGPEWEAFTHPEHAPRGEDFLLRDVPPPARFAGRIESVVLGERLREVVALIAFSRIDAPEEGQ